MSVTSDYLEIALWHFIWRSVIARRCFNNYPDSPQEDACPAAVSKNYNCLWFNSSALPNLSPIWLIQMFCKTDNTETFCCVFFFCIILWIFFIFIIVQFCTLEFFFSFKKNYLSTTASQNCLIRKIQLVKIVRSMVIGFSHIQIEMNSLS